jgi:hypothetical protein
MTDITTIINATDLDALCTALNDVEREHGTSASKVLGGNFLATELPTFGGHDPEDMMPGETEGVWSWDKTRLLASAPEGGFEIVSREDYE